MTALQTSYSETQRVALPGMPATMHGYDVDTRQCETVAGIGFGLGVSQGSADKGVLLGVASAALFAGVSMRDVTQDVANLDKFVRYGDVPVMTRGDIWVTVGSDVAKGADVTVVVSTGVLGSVAADGTHLLIAGARWMTTASNGGLAILRLSGHLPAA